MATGKVQWSALMTPHQEIYNGRSAKTWSLIQEGTFPQTAYKINSAVIKFDIRNTYNRDRHMVVLRRDGETDTILGDVPTGTKGEHTEALNTSANYEGMTILKLDGVERWACQLRGGSYVVIEVVWEETEPVVVDPPDQPNGLDFINGSLTSGDDVDRALHTEFFVSLDGVDISEPVNKYLLSASYTDNEEDEADDLQIKLEDADGTWLGKWLDDTLQASISGSAPATKGLTIQAAIKVSDAAGNVKQVDCGGFELDSMKAAGPPSTVTLKGTSLPFGGGARTEERDKAWESYSLSRIGSEIASGAGMGFLYDSPSDPFYARVEQDKQTNIAFLQELCHKAGLSLKASRQRLVIFDQERYEKMQEVTTIRWMDGTYTKYDLSTSRGDTHYASCRVSYYHPMKKELIECTVKAEDYDPESKNNQVLVVTNEAVDTVAEAQVLAEKMLRLHNKYERSASFTMLGNPLLSAGLTARLEGFGPWNGKYIIKQCKHEIGASGYTTKITLRIVPLASEQEKAAEETNSGGSSGSSGKKPSSSKAKHWEVVRGTPLLDKPGGKSTVSITPGTRVAILGTTTGDYTYISAGGKTGYVATGALKKVDGE